MVGLASRLDYAVMRASHAAALAILLPVACSLTNSVDDLKNGSALDGGAASGGTTGGSGGTAGAAATGGSTGGTGGSAGGSGGSAGGTGGSAGGAGGADAATGGGPATDAASDAHNPLLCFNQTLDGDETDIDCGGDTCGPCGDGQLCAMASRDCSSRVCTRNVCIAAECDDLVQNGDETDVDCGGGTCAVCTDGLGCEEGEGPRDCTNSVCAGGICQSPTCSDGATNGNETDVDCGGPQCGGCLGGRNCTLPSDCSSGECRAGMCTGLVAHWAFDEGAGTVAVDGSGNDNNAAIIGPLWVPGVSGMALNFVGSTTITASHSPTLDLTTEMTLSMWLTADAFPINWHVPLIKSSTGQWLDGYGIFYDQAQGNLCVYVTAFANRACSPFSPTPAFRHVAGTYDGTTLRLFLDGVETATLPLPGTISSTAEALLISHDEFPGRQWLGRMDEVRIYNRALDAAEILALHDSP